MYTSKENVQAALQRELTADEILNLKILNSLIKAYIDTETGRSFTLTPAEDDEYEARYFDGNGSNTIYIDDAVEISEVAEYEVETETATEITTGNYITKPYNRLPISTIVRIDGGTFGRGLKTVKVSGKWGYATETPAEITAIATYLAVQVFNNPEALQQENIEGYGRTFSTMLPPLYKDVLENLTKVSL